MKKIVFLMIFYTFSSMAYSEHSPLLNNFHESQDTFSVELATLKNDLANSSKKNPSKCPSIEILSDKKEIIFIFEGYKSYSPKVEVFWKFLKSHNFDGPNEFIKHCSEMNIELCLSLREEVAYEIHGSGRAGALSLARPYFNDQSKFFKYYGQGHFKEAKSCLRSLIKESGIKNVKLPDVKIMGYSYGGNTAQKLSKEIDTNKNIEIKAVFTIDPVRKGPGVLKNLLTKANANRFFTKSKNVEAYFNIYQKSNKNGLGLSGIKGNKINGTNSKNIKIDRFEKHAHGLMIDIQESKDLMEEFINY